MGRLPVEIRRAPARSILSKTSGFIARAGFTHSLTPARNCSFGCVYCYVPTMRIQGGLKPEDWRRWGRLTTFKSNAAELLARELRPERIVYCSPLTDPYQPAEKSERAMPPILDRLIAAPPKVFVIQTRGTLIVRDLELLRELARRTTLRISFSLTTDRENVRRLYEPHCEPTADRLGAMAALRDAGLAVHATLAPILPCDPERLADWALRATDLAVVVDPFHVRSLKPSGATTRPEALRLSAARGFDAWHEPSFQAEIVERIRRQVEAAGRGFGIGPEGFALLAAPIRAQPARASLSR